MGNIVHRYVLFCTCKILRIQIAWERAGAISRSSGLMHPGSKN